MAVKSGATLQTVDRALQMLLCFDGKNQYWRAAELTRHLGWDKSVTHRLLTTLANRGFLALDPRTHVYRLGISTYHLGQIAAHDNPLTPVVRPLARELARACGESVLFTIQEDDESHCLVAVEGPSPISYSTQVGRRLPGHVGAGSKALFAWSSESEQQQLFAGRPLARFTDTTITDPEQLWTEFTSIRQHGYAVSDGELDPDVGAIAVPVRRGHAVVGALSAVGPQTRVTRRRDALVQQLLHGADKASARLSATPAVPGATAGEVRSTLHTGIA